MSPEQWQASDWHVSRAWPGHPDPFAFAPAAPTCGCEKLKCGHVSLNAANAAHCEQHSFAGGKTIRSSHPDWACEA